MPDGSSFVPVFEKCREFVTHSVKLRSSEFAETIGLIVPGPNFEQEIIQALIESVGYHLSLKPKKRSDLRKQMLRLDKAARTAAKAVRKVQLALDKVDPIYRAAILEHKPHLVFPLKTALTLQSLSDTAHIYVVGFSGSGGAPKMIAFEILVNRLGAVFQRAVGRAAKVTWNPYKKRYEGKFVKLVEALLPIALECTEGLGSKMPCPKIARARGKYISQITGSRASAPQCTKPNTALPSVRGIIRARAESDKHRSIGAQMRATFAE
jgi:hypothetical protein